jgi:hypothetical protein
VLLTLHKRRKRALQEAVGGRGGGGAASRDNAGSRHCRLSSEELVLEARWTMARKHSRANHPGSFPPSLVSYRDSRASSRARCSPRCRDERERGDKVSLFSLRLSSRIALVLPSTSLPTGVGSRTPKTQRDEVVSETRDFSSRLARSARIKRGDAPSEIQRKAAECAEETRLSPSPSVCFPKGLKKKRPTEGTREEA